MFVKKKNLAAPGASGIAFDPRPPALELREIGRLRLDQDAAPAQRIFEKERVRICTAVVGP
jgi:hypothetical protein